MFPLALFTPVAHAATAAGQGLARGAAAIAPTHAAGGLAPEAAAVTPTHVAGGLVPETVAGPRALLRPVGVGDPAPAPPPISPAAGLPSSSQQAAMQHGIGMDRRPRLPHEGRMRAMNIAHQVLGGLGPAMRAQAASGDQFGPSMLPTLMGSIPHQPMPPVVFP